MSIHIDPETKAIESREYIGELHNRMEQAADVIAAKSRFDSSIHEALRRNARELRRTHRRHGWHVLLFTASFIALMTSIAVAWQPSDCLCRFGALAVTLPSTVIIAGWGHWRRWLRFKSSITMLLVVALIGPGLTLNAQTTAQPPPRPPHPQKNSLIGWIAGGVLIGAVLGGLIIAFKRACDKGQKKKEKRDKENSGDDQAQAYRGCPTGTCAYLADGFTIPERIFFEFDILDGKIDLKSFRTIGNDQLMNWWEWRDIMNRNGLPVTGEGWNQDHTNTELLEFTPTGLKINGGGRQMTIWHTEDLVNWHPLSTFEAPTGTPYHVEDSTTERHAFYRIDYETEHDAFTRRVYEQLEEAQ